MSSNDTIPIITASIAPIIGLLSGYILLRVRKQKPRRTVEDHLDTFLEAIITENKTLRKEVEKRDTILEAKDKELNYLRAFAANKKANARESGKTSQ